MPSIATVTTAFHFLNDSQGWVALPPSGDQGPHAGKVQQRWRRGGAAKGHAGHGKPASGFPVVGTIMGGSLCTSISSSTADAASDWGTLYHSTYDLSTTWVDLGLPADAQAVKVLSVAASYQHRWFPSGEHKPGQAYKAHPNHHTRDVQGQPHFGSMQSGPLSLYANGTLLGDLCPAWLEPGDDLSLLASGQPSPARNAAGPHVQDDHNVNWRSAQGSIDIPAAYGAPVTSIKLSLKAALTPLATNSALSPSLSPDAPRHTPMLGRSFAWVRLQQDRVQLAITYSFDPPASPASLLMTLRKATVNR